MIFIYSVQWFYMQVLDQKCYWRLQWEINTKKTLDSIQVLKVSILLNCRVASKFSLIWNLYIFVDNTFYELPYFISHQLYFKRVRCSKVLHFVNVYNFIQSFVGITQRNLFCGYLSIYIHVQISPELLLYIKKKPAHDLIKFEFP